MHTSLRPDWATLQDPKSKMYKITCPYQLCNRQRYQKVMSLKSYTVDLRRVLFKLFTSSLRCQSRDRNTNCISSVCCLLAALHHVVSGLCCFLYSLDKQTKNTPTFCYFDFCLAVLNIVQFSLKMKA